MIYSDFKIMATFQEENVLKRKRIGFIWICNISFFKKH